VSESPNHDLLTAKEAADYLRVPLSSLYYLARRRQIPAIQIGGRWRIKKSSLDRHVLGATTRKVVSGEIEVKEPQTRHLLTDQGTLSQFEEWDPSHMKTGLRNRCIGKKVPVQVRMKS
jgi:excisionase family DNA binding protein